MLTRRIIPCLDVKNGRIVKGVQFKDLRDAGDPVAAAKLYQDQGADELVILDITATVENRMATLSLVHDVRQVLSIPLTVGGGVRSLADVQALLNVGADKVSLNSAALAQPDLITQVANAYGRQCTVVAIDAKDGKVFTRAGHDATAWDVTAWAKQAEQLGAGEILLTSMNRDGQQSGYDTDLLRAVSGSVAIPVIASGGAGQLPDFLAALQAGASAVLAASLFHDGILSIPDVKTYLSQAGQEIRP
jgi:imidazoleglycerol phosphate synthase cyclase subunit